MITGEVKIDRDEFAARVLNFFGGNTQYADLFVEHWFSDGVKFPPDMLAYIWLHSDHVDVIAFPVDELN